jgi:ATP-dependent DNA helicase RecG
VLQLDDSVELIAGVGPSRAADLRGGDILSVGDLLMYLPMRYEDRSQRLLVGSLQPGQCVGVEAEVLSVRRKGPLGWRQQVEMRIGDDSGEVQVVWFNQPYMAGRFERGDRVHLFGLVDEYKGTLQIVNPVVADADAAEPSLHVGRAVPVYRRIGGLGPGMLRRLVAAALEALGTESGRLPASVMDEHGLMPLRQALSELHYPPGGAHLEHWEELRSDAHRSLVMGELVDFQVVLSLQRRRAAGERSFARQLAPESLEAIVTELPFRLTAAQERVLAEIMVDLVAPAPMHRLVQGDVGCGKTAVLGAAAIAVALAGDQVAVLAPTEILVRQHLATLAPWAAEVGVEVIALTGADSTAVRRQQRQRLREGGPIIAVGTHALLERDVKFARLGLVVVDEQHRFGVGQRAALRDKGQRQGAQPDLLVTTATPIPRSLALTLYGDLEISRIDEMPPGRLPVVTRQLSRSSRTEIVGKLEEVIAAGGRAFVVVPAIESEDDDDATMATVAKLAEWLRRALGESCVGILHGRQDGKTKAAAMDDFAAGTTPVLVATTVVEVGVDVPAATLMVVVQANRFGLAQLHQLRGRVGRGETPGECWLLADEPLADSARVRLDTLCRTHDGFEVAEEDLLLRGAGELLGYRQTGPFGFRIANPRRHYDWLLAARDVAAHLLESNDAEAGDYRRALRQSWRLRMRLARAG